MIRFCFERKSKTNTLRFARAQVKRIKKLGTMNFCWSYSLKYAGSNGTNRAYLFLFYCAKQIKQIDVLSCERSSNESEISD